MSSSYPASIDSESEIAIAVDSTTPVDAALINNMRDAVIKVETELGTVPKGTFSNVRARLDAIEDSVDELVVDMATLQSSFTTLQTNFNALQSDFNALEILVNSLNDLPDPIGTDGAVIIEDGLGNYEQRRLTADDIDGLTAALASEITVTPATNQNDYNPTGWSAATTVRLNPSASIYITGFQSRIAGSRVILRNVSTYLVVLVAGNANSLVANRLQSNGVETHVTMLPGDTVQLLYDGTDTKWVISRLFNIMRDVGTRREWKPRSSGAMNSGDLVQSAIGGTVTTPSPATSSFVNARYRTTYSAVGATGTSIGLRNGSSVTYYLMGNGSGLGGFAFYSGFGITGIPDTGATAFVGMYPDLLGNNNASTMINCAGFAIDPADANWYFQHNDGTGTATRVSLGTDFARSTTAWYGGIVYSDPNATRVSYSIWRMDDSSLLPAVGDAATDLPAANLQTQFLLCTRASSASGHAISVDNLTIWTPTGS